MSQAQEVIEKIGEHEYTMYMLPPIASHDLLMDVAKMIGPSFGSLMAGLMPSGKQEKNNETLASLGEALGEDAKEDSLGDKEINGVFIEKAITTLFTDLDKTVLHRVIKLLTDVTHVDGKELRKNFDIHFRGSLDQMYLWIAFGMRVQWGKSLSALVSGASGPGAQGLRDLLKSQIT